MKQEETMQLRINAVKDLVLVLSEGIQEQDKSKVDILKQYIEKNKNQSLEILNEKQSLENELHTLINSNFALESQIKGFRDKVKDSK